MEQQYSLRWNNYLNQITNAFDALKNEEDLVDVTLSCEGRKIKAHKILLSACSPYFRDIFKENPCQHPVIVFRDFKHVDLQAIIDFMYKGEVDVKQDSFESFLRAAELLQVKGLTDGCKENSSCEREDCDLSKIIESDSEIPTDDLATPLAVSRPKKRKNSKTTEKEKPLDKKQKSALTDKAFIPKQEFIEDLTFEKRVSESSNTDQSELLPKYCESKKEIRPLPKGPGTSLELSSDMLMQSIVYSTVNQDGHVCMQCGAKYEHKSTLVAHLKTHTGETSCYICNKVLSSVIAQKRHLALIHNIIK